MRRGKRTPFAPAPGTLLYEMTAPQRAAMFLECCQAIAEHRFDCRVSTREQRGAGPFGPLRCPDRPPCGAQLP